MNFDKSIIIVAGEPNSVFLEIFFKSIKNIKIKKPLILIASHKLVMMQMTKLKYNKKIRILDLKNILETKLDNKKINLININYTPSKTFEPISSKSNSYIENGFEIAFKLIKKNDLKRLITGPISKKFFLKKKYLGITEYISKKFKIKKNAMLIYNKNFSVCPLTTHMPLKFVTKKIDQKLIIEKIKLINDFYLKNLNLKPRIGVLGINPHCESVDKFNEDEKILIPSIKKLKKLKYKITGPISADTAFMKNNIKNYDVLLGMYHDQVLTPMKTLFEYDAINITLGLPFLRVSPDHGPNEKMIGKNVSNPLSLIKAISFLDKH